MWGIESQRQLVRERMKLLLAAHDSEIVPERTCSMLRQRGHAIADAANRLTALHALGPRRLS